MNDDQIISGPSPPQEDQMLSLIRRFYNRIRFYALDNIQKPFIFAYSQFVDDDIEKRCQNVGFDCCINSVLGPKELSYVINTFINSYCIKFLDQKISEKVHLERMLELVMDLNKEPIHLRKPSSYKLVNQKKK
jgi:hypothetical protein